MRPLFVTTVDYAAVAFGSIAQPALRMIARKRMALPRFQRFADRAGFQLRSSHYYEPTYSEDDLPQTTDVERSLPGIDLREEEQLALLARFRFAEELATIPMDPPSDHEFGYRNKMYGVGDAELYYSMIRLKKPRRIIEIGSGNSTLIAQRAVAANRAENSGYRCEQICIEPYEMPWLEATGVSVIRQRVEKVPLDFFDHLEGGDILFIDSSHVIRPWGDVLREFQEIIPRLREGVLVHIDDIFTPRDYPEKWLRDDRRLWNEQYLLEAFLAFNDRYRVLCAANWLKHNAFDQLVAACPMVARVPECEPGAFWIEAL